MLSISWGVPHLIQDIFIPQHSGITGSKDGEFEKCLLIIGHHIRSQAVVTTIEQDFTLITANITTLQAKSLRLVDYGSHYL